MENNLLSLIHHVMNADIKVKYQMNCTGLEKQGNLKFLTLWWSFLQNKASKLGTFLGTVGIKTTYNIEWNQEVRYVLERSSCKLLQKTERQNS